jgi:hypothetical protein
MAKNTFSPEKFKLFTKQLAQQKQSQKEFLINGIQTVPVPQDVFNKLIWTAGEDAQEIMGHHSGYDLHNKIESLQRALKTYRRCNKDLIARLDTFDTASKDAALFQRPRAAELEEYEIGCRKEIFALSSAAAALVDLARHVTKSVNISDFNKMRKQCFDSKQHEFIKKLRNNLNHVTFLESDWTIKNVGQEQTSHFEFKTARLLRDGDFNEEARDYIENQGETIDIRNLFISYDNCIDAFYGWLIPKIESQLPLEVQDYRRCIKEMKANSARCWYRILFHQIIKPGTDLYSHLHNYLTREELKEVNALPHRSKEQVDRIIELVDEYDACNDELRDMVYKAFSVG